MPFEWVAIKCAAQNHTVSGNLAVHHRAGRDRRLTTAAEAFVGVRPALQRGRAAVAAGGANKPLRPASLEQKRRAARLVGKAD